MRLFFAILMVVYGCMQRTYSQQILEVDVLESFMDGAIGALMEKDHINGVTACVINRDSLLWSKGYGYADSEDNILVDPATSLFRMGSVSKLFVWTAVMQLYEKGLINLDADISSYIDDFDIPDNYQDPITMKNLMSHSPGFEDYYFQLFSTDSLPPESLGRELNQHMPSRVREPGKHSSYSNHGTAIAAYIVEEVSGMKWDDYVETKILEPLGMARTSFRYIIPEDLKLIHSKGYTFSGGTYQSHPLKGIPLAPAGLACTSADDISKFMLAHLNNGKYNNYQMLDSATVALMHSTLFTHDDDLRGFCYGFFDLSRNGHKIIGHGGATEYFFSNLILLPDDGYGMFISTNTQGGGSLSREVTDLFLDKYFPDTMTIPVQLNLSDEFLGQYCGQYLPNRRPFKRMTRLAALTNSTINVTSSDGMLITSGTNRWFPVDSNLFRNTQSTSLLSFQKDNSGKYKYLYMDSSPHTVLERVSLWESKTFNITVLLWGAGMGMLALFWWIISYAFRKYYRVQSRNNLPLVSKVLVICNTLLIIIFLVIAGVLIGSTDFVFRPRNIMDYVIFSIPLIIAILSLCVLYLSVLHFRKRVKWRSRIFYLLISLGMGMVTVMMYFWNLIGYKF